MTTLEEKFKLIKLGAETFRAVLLDIGIILGILGALAQGGDLVLKKVNFGSGGIDVAYEAKERKTVKLEAIRIEGAGTGSTDKKLRLMHPDKLKQLSLKNKKEQDMITLRNWIFGIMMLGLLGLFFRKKKKRKVEYL